MTPAETASLLLEQSSQPDFSQTFQQLAPQVTPAVLTVLVDFIYDEMRRNAQRAMQIVEVAEMVANRLGTALAHGRVTWIRGNVLFCQNHYPEALACFQKAESIYRLEEDALILAGLQINQVACYRDMGNYPAALSQEVKARATCEAIGQRALGYLANLEMTVGWIYEEMGQPETALAIYERGRAIYVQQGNPIQTALIDVNRAYTLLKTNRFLEAEVWLQSALTTLRSGGYDQEVARAELNWGMLSSRTGRYQEALHHLDTAYYQFAVIPLPVEMAYVNIERAYLYNRLHLFEDMVTLATAAEKVFQRHHMRRELNRSILYQGIAYQQLGLLDIAEKKLNRVRRYLQQQKAEAEVWAVDVQRARLYETMNQPDRAGRIARRLAKAVDPTQVPSSAGQAQLLLARWAIIRERWPEAHHHLQMVHELAQTYHLAELEIEASHTAGLMIEKRGQLAHALQKYQLAIKQAQQLQAFFSLDELQLGFATSKQPIYQDAVRLSRLLVQTEELPASHLLAALNQAYSSPLLQMSAESNPDRPSPWQTQLVELRQRWQWYQGYMDVFHHSEQPVIGFDRTEWQQQMTQIETEITELQRRERTWQTANSHTLTVDEVVSSPAQLQERIQTHLNPGEGLLHYFVVDDQLQALWVTSNSVELFPHLTPITRLQRLMKAWRFHLKYAQVTRPDTNLPPQHTQLYLQELYQLCLAPFCSHLADLQHLYLIVPPEWHDIPLAALFDGQQYFIETCQLSYLSTPSALWRKLVAPARQGQPTLVVGYSDNGRLPHAVAEAQAIRQLFAPEHVTCLLEAEATRDAFEAASQQAGIIHLATHALFRPDNPMFSWVRLADDHLTMGDLYHLRLPKRPLVVLSACETGKGQARGGGLSGIGRALLAAGARGLVVTLWPVGDKSTAEWMAWFYQYLSQVPPALALGMAQREAIQHGRDPLTWAGFLFIAG